MEECEVELEQTIKKKVMSPSKYKVIFIDDSETPYEWVVALLMKVFNYSQDNANQKASEIDMGGSGVVGVYTFEIADQKASEGIALSRSNGFPLDIKIEKN